MCQHQAVPDPHPHLSNSANLPHARTKTSAVYTFGLYTRGLTSYGLYSYGTVHLGLTRRNGGVNTRTSFGDFSGHADGERRGLDRSAPFPMLPSDSIGG